MEIKRFDPSDHYTMWSDGATTVVFQDSALYRQSGERITGKMLSENRHSYDMIPVDISSAIIALDDSPAEDALSDLDEGMGKDPHNILAAMSSRLNRPRPDERFMVAQQRGIKMVQRMK